MIFLLLRFAFAGELTRDRSAHIKLSVFITSRNLLRVTQTDFGFRIFFETRSAGDYSVSSWQSRVRMSCREFTYIFMLEPCQDFNFAQCSLAIRLMFERRNLLDGDLCFCYGVVSRSARRQQKGIVIIINDKWSFRKEARARDTWCRLFMIKLWDWNCSRNETGIATEKWDRDREMSRLMFPWQVNTALAARLNQSCLNRRQTDELRNNESDKLLSNESFYGNPLIYAEKLRLMNVGN